MIFEKEFKWKWVVAKYVEECKIIEWDGVKNVGEGNKTKELMENGGDFKDGSTPFGNLIFMILMEGIIEG